jgi:DNA-directed RNA polymerase subunit K/omega
MSAFEPEYRSEDEEEDKVVRRRGEDEDEEDDYDEDDVPKGGSEDEEDNVDGDEDDDDDDEDDDEDEDEGNDEGDDVDDGTQLLPQQQRQGMLDDVVEDEEEGGYGYLKKFDTNVRYSMVEEHHPELLVENNEDVQARTFIQRDDQGNIVDPHHRTVPLLTKYEKARVLGERAKQLNSGAKPFLDVPETVLDGYLIARMEFEAKKIPFIIKRPLRNGTCEYWKVCDLETL